MSLLSEINTVVGCCGIQVETGKFSGQPPDEYIVITPLGDTFDLHADNAPGYDVQEARLSLFKKDSYIKQKNQLVKALLEADFTITDRRYIGYEADTGYHHYTVDVAKYYEMEE